LSGWTFAKAPVRNITGRFWRMLAPRWSYEPLSGAGAAARGGRWNAPGQPALYLSAEHATAVAEYTQALVRPGTLTPYDVSAEAVLDLTDAAVRAVLSLDEALLRLAWRRIRDVEHGRPKTWDFALAAAKSGIGGLLVPSTQAVGVNLVLWRWNVAEGARITVVDPADDLPRNPSSWPP
jgi:RES domain-containing protein